MKVIIKEISETDFKKINLPILFDNELFDRVFGIIFHKRNVFKIGWQSTIVKPIISSITTNIYSIGIDLNFVIFNLSEEKILQKMNLNYFFYDTKIYNDFLYIITELEIIKINILDLKVNQKYTLTDYFESIEFIEDNAIVKSVDGNLFYLA